MEFKIENDELLLTVEKSVYNIDILYKCFYWYGANFDVSISDFSRQSYAIKLIPKNCGTNLDEIVSRVKRDLVDFKLRDIVTKETQVIRELIIAKAFAYYEDTTNPLTEISDPVGFEPGNL